MRGASARRRVLFVGFGFSDDRRVFVPVLVLFVFFVLVIIIGGSGCEPTRQRRIDIAGGPLID